MWLGARSASEIRVESAGIENGVRVEGVLQSLVQRFDWRAEWVEHLLVVARMSEQRGIPTQRFGGAAYALR